MNIKDLVRLLTRLLNIAFWMILAYLAGDVGMGFYYLGFIFAEVLTVIFCGGLKQSIAKMVAVRRAKGLHYNSKLIFRYGVLYSLIIGLAFGFVIWTFSGQIYLKAVGYILPESVFAVIGIYFAIHMLDGCLQGYYQGRGNTLICIVAEVAKTIISLILCPILVIRMYKYGMNISGLLKNPLYANIGGAIGAVMAQCIGGILCILILIVGDRIAGTVDRNEYNSVKGVDNGRNITLSFLKGCLMYLAEHIMPVLTIAGLLYIYVRTASANGADIKETFTGVGVFAGKYLVILGLIIAFFVEFVDRECKKIRVDVAHEEHKNVRQRATYLLKNTVILLLPITLMIVISSGAIVNILFAGRTSLGVDLLRKGGIVLLLAGISYMCKNVFNSIRISRYSLVGSASGMIVALLCASAMVGDGNNPSGLVIAYVIGYMVETLILLIVFYRMIGFDIIDIGIRMGKIVVSAGIFAGMLAIMDNFIVMNLLFMIIAILIAYVAYSVTLVVLKGVGTRDINSLKGTLIYYPLVFVGNFFVNR
ncbi:MAG: hypothetical protein K5868_08100 [Lachnospiraceae bacterium]|nr:hypothetical protein [Lachnospiraceae bacterium]